MRKEGKGRDCSDPITDQDTSFAPICLSGDISAKGIQHSSSSERSLQIPQNSEEFLLSLRMGVRRMSVGGWGGWHQVTSLCRSQPRLKPILGLGFGLAVPWDGAPRTPARAEGKKKSGTYDKLVAAAEIAFTVDHSGTLGRSPSSHSGSRDLRKFFAVFNFLARARFVLPDSPES